MTRGSLFAVGIVAITMFASGTPQALASLGHLAATRARYMGTINLGAEKYFTVNLRPGLSARDAAEVASYFRAFGLQVSASPDHEILFAHGTYGQAGAAAHTSFARYELNHEQFTSVTGPQTFPPNIAARIIATTINDGPRMHPLYTLRPAGFFDPTGGFTAAQYESYYDVSPILGAGINGSGQVADIFACATVSNSDITTFESTMSLPSNTPSVISVDGGNTSTDLEPTGDVESEVSTAPKETINLYVVPSDCSTGEMADALARMFTDLSTKHERTINISYGLSEDDIVSSGDTVDENAIHADLVKLWLAGVTPFIASGDSGSFEDQSSPFWFTPGEITVSYPASDPDAMAVGGTSALTTSSSTSTRLKEIAWSGSGGGVSLTWPIPTRQVGVPGIASTTLRNVPDVALNADLNTGYQIYYAADFGLLTAGGTSFAAPRWAAFVALINQKRVALGKAQLTGVGKNIYLQRTTAGDFFDIVNGSNGFYNAQVGYDNVTGLGVFDALKLYNSLVALP